MIRRRFEFLLKCIMKLIISILTLRVGSREALLVSRMSAATRTIWKPPPRRAAADRWLVRRQSYRRQAEGEVDLSYHLHGDTDTRQNPVLLKNANIKLTHIHFMYTVYTVYTICTVIFF